MPLRRRLVVCSCCLVWFSILCKCFTLVLNGWVWLGGGFASFSGGFACRDCGLIVYVVLGFVCFVG